MAPLVLHVTGARPNFPKAAPVLEGLGAYDVEQLLVHTGQHYDDKMSDIFFRQLGIPKPDVNLGVGSGAHGAQTAKVMEALEELFTERRPDLVVVYGDVNSTVAAALVASKMGITFAHVEAGLRSFDMTMPEEINRLVTDKLSDLLLTTSTDAIGHLGDRDVGRRARAPCEAIEQPLRRRALVVRRAQQHLAPAPAVQPHPGERADEGVRQQQDGEDEQQGQEFHRVPLGGRAGPGSSAGAAPRAGPRRHESVAPRLYGKVAAGYESV